MIDTEQNCYADWIEDPKLYEMGQIVRNALGDSEFREYHVRVARAVIAFSNAHPPESIQAMYPGSSGRPLDGADPSISQADVLPNRLAPAPVEESGGK